MSAAPRHCLLRALILSLAIHAILLLGVVSVLPVRLPDSPPALLNVALNADPVPVPAAVLSGVKQRVVKPVTPLPPVSAQRTPLHVAGNAAMVTPLPASPVPSESAAAPSAVLDRTPGATNAQTTLPGSSTVAAGDELNASDLRQYRLSLAIAARRFRNYPALARARGWEGVSEISLTVSAHLLGPEVIVARSSGHAVLDRQAQEMMAQAARTTVLPESLRGRDFRILLPVQFSLDADQ